MISKDSFYLILPFYKLLKKADMDDICIHMERQISITMGIKRWLNSKVTNSKTKRTLHKIRTYIHDRGETNKIVEFMMEMWVLEITTKYSQQKLLRLSPTFKYYKLSSSCALIHNSKTSALKFLTTTVQKLLRF